MVLERDIQEAQKGVVSGPNTLGHIVYNANDKGISQQKEKVQFIILFSESVQTFLQRCI